MKFVVLLLLLTCFWGVAETPVLVLQVQTALAAGDLQLASQELKQFRDRRGINPEYIEALSWIGRAQLAHRDYAAAVANSEQVRQLCLAELKRRRLDADASLPNALGASIEVQALGAAQQGRRDEAVLFLRQQLRLWGTTSIHNRIQKNLNLLTLEGKPAPALDLISLRLYRGHPVLLFFWAHWCSDCKHEAAILQHIQQRFAAAGLVLIAPTQHYGYVAGGREAPHQEETQYIHQIWDQYYAGLGHPPMPVSEINFASYGVSTTPTLVLVDGRGIVRMYNPGALDEAQLAHSIQAVIKE